MSAINIEGMAQIVRAHGLEPVAIDIDSDALAPTPEAIDRAGGSNARLFLVAHLFGAVLPLEPYAEVCRRRGLLLVEDRAQAFAAALEGDPAAHVSLYSFGPIKTATALGGGIALFRDPGLAQRVRAVLAGHAPLSDGWFLRRAAKYATLKAASAPLPYGLLLGALRLLGRDPESAVAGSVRGFGSGELLGRIRRRPPPRLLALLARRLASASDQQSRRERALFLLARLRGRARPGAAVARHTHWVVPVLSSDPDGLVARLRARGFDATRGATSLRAPGEAPNARRLLAEAVYLPVSPFTSRRTLDRLAAVLNEDAPQGVRA
jgi:dTDP-4-amino-4,6-dideoxygalactose transaminase